MSVELCRGKTAERWRKALGPENMDSRAKEKRLFWYFARSFLSNCKSPMPTSGVEMVLPICGGDVGEGVDGDASSGLVGSRCQGHDIQIDQATASL